MNRELILAHVQEPSYRPGKIKELARALGVAQPQYREFRDAVKQLEREGELVRLRHNRYVHPSQVARVAGLLRLHPLGYGRVAPGGGQREIFVRADALKGAADGDVVQVEIVASRKGGEAEGRVVEILQRGEQQVVGTFYWQGRHGVVRPDDPRWGEDIHLSRRPPPEVSDGYKVRLWIAEAHRGVWQGQIQEVLGDPADPRLDFLAVVSGLGLPLDYPSAALAEAARIPLGLEAEAGGRRDLRGLTCFTIDPADARDFDDAVSVQALEGGRHLVGVHIADVSHYVRQDTALDREALRRGNSVYLVDRVIPMLPERLSSQICTLLPGQDRLALSVLMRISPEGVVEDFEVVESAIRSAARLTYEQAQDLCDRGMGEFAQVLGLMLELSQRLKERRLERGALDFDLPEARVVLDEGGMPTALGRSCRLQSHQLIEEFMLAANECIGRLASDHRLPVLYRVHQHPNQEKLRLFAEYINALGGRFDKRKKIAPKDLQLLLAQFADREDAGLINRLLLRAMMRAEYAPRDSGHYGLACLHYLHFTSPIRRYPDLLVHRALKAFLAGKLDERLRRAWEAELPWIGVWTSTCERRADEAERTYVKSKQLRYMEDRLGEEFAGLVSGVMRGGLFVELEDLMVEGFCPLAFLEDHYEFDERRHCLRGRRAGRSFSLGTPVRVQVARVDWAPPRLDLRLIEEESGRPAARKKQRARHR